MTAPLFLPAMAIATCLGSGKAATAATLFRGSRHGLVPRDDVLPNRRVFLGACLDDLPGPLAGFPELDCRNNRLLAALLAEIEAPIQAAIHAHGPHRIAVVLGTSTAGIAEGEDAVDRYLHDGRWPQDYDYRQQETGNAATFVSRRLGLDGPAYVIATACSSSSKAFASARRLIRLGLADAALVGGADTLCRMTVAGFSSLEAVSPTPCNPFSRNRNGITIGEGGALFLLTRDPAEVALLGIGEGSDAHHVSAPDPSGAGAQATMETALADAGLRPDEIAYINLHGTATPLNDAMESRATHAVFGEAIACSSTKAMTGHTLGAAGAVEAAILWLTLSRQWNPEGLLPPHLWDGEADPELCRLAFTEQGDALPTDARVACLSNSFAFGGSNCSLILGRGWTA